MNKKTGGLAFPVQDAYSMSTEKGMELRDYFAAKVLQGFVASNTWSGNIEITVAESYEIADAMLKEREA